MALGDARPVPEKNVAYRVSFPILDADGDLVTGAAALDSEISKDGGTFTDVTAEATEIATNSGMYFLDLTATEMNADTVVIIVKTSTGGAKTTPIVMYPEEAGDIRVNLTQVAGATINALVSGRMDASVGAMAANVLTATAIATDAITAAKIAANAIGASELATDAIGDDQIATGAIAATAFAAGAIDNAAFNVTETLTANPAAGGIVAASFGAGAIDAAAIATDAIDADAIAADAVAELRSLVTGTSDSGSSTTMVDAVRTEADDVWNGCWIMSTSGATINQIRLITNFVASSDTMTFAPAMTASIGTSTYEILPAGAVDLQSWLGIVTGLVAPNALVAGAVDADVSALQANVITATSIATAAIAAAKFAAGAIDAAALATDAVQEIVDGVLDEAIAGHVGAGTVGNLVERLDLLATGGSGGLTDARAVLLSNLDAAISTVATPAQVNTEVLDVLNVDTITLPGQVAPPLAPTHRQALGHLYKAYRNRKTQTATQWSLLDDGETVVDQKATVSDDGSTAIKQEIVTGP